MSQAIAYTQVRDIALTTGNDFLVGASPNGVDLQLIGDAEALAQAVNIALQSFAGEWFLNTDDGVPYWQSVFIKNPNPTLLQALFRTQILNVDGITSVTSLTIAYNALARNVTINWTALGSTPVVPISGQPVIQL
jgi:hypothetical protein